MLGRTLAAVAIAAGFLIAPGSSLPSAAQSTAVSAAKPSRPQVRKSHGRPKVVVRRWRGYGFLPGYTPPDFRDRPANTYQYWRGRDWDGFPVGSYGTGGFGGMWYRGRFTNGIGPCWTRTPIGPLWNCG